MNSRTLSVILTCSLIVGFIFATFPSSFAEDACILGYPYYTTQGVGSGAKYDAYGSLFTLNGNADITSMSCLMDGGYSPTEPDDRYIYRYAIYSDNNGAAGALIGQTETGTFTGKAGGSNDVWNMASFPQALHLNAGSYWLVAVHNATQYITIHDEYPAANYTIFTCVIGGMDFPSALNTPIYSQNFVLSIYASGTGTPSISQPITTPNHQQVSRLIVGCVMDQTSAMYKVLIKGNLTANYAPIPSAPVLLSYADNPNATWHEIATVTTASDGSFTTPWLPINTGNYVINATYVGNSNYTAQTTLTNILLPTYGSVFSVGSNSTVTQLDFNSQTNQLSFSVSGTSQTTGYAVIYVPKGFVDDPSKIKASIDGASTDFTVTAADEAWVLYFDYQHSTHDVILSLGSQNAPTPSEDSTAPPTNIPTATPIPELTLVTAAGAIAVLFAVILIVKHRRLTSKKDTEN